MYVEWLKNSPFYVVKCVLLLQLISRTTGAGCSVDHGNGMNYPTTTASGTWTTRGGISSYGWDSRQPIDPCSRCTNVPPPLPGSQYTTHVYDNHNPNDRVGGYMSDNRGSGYSSDNRGNGHGYDNRITGYGSDNRVNSYNFDNRGSSGRHPAAAGRPNDYNSNSHGSSGYSSYNNYGGNNHVADNQVNGYSVGNSNGNPDYRGNGYDNLSPEWQRRHGNKNGGFYQGSSYPVPNMVSAVHAEHAHENYHRPMSNDKWNMKGAYPVKIESSGYWQSQPPKDIGWDEDSKRVGVIAGWIGGPKKYDSGTKPLQSYNSHQTNDKDDEYFNKGTGYENSDRKKPFMGWGGSGSYEVVKMNNGYKYIDRNGNSDYGTQSAYGSNYGYGGQSSYSNSRPNQDYGGSKYGNNKPSQDYGGHGYSNNKPNQDHGGQNYGNNKPNQDFGGQNYGNNKPNQDFGGQNYGNSRPNQDFGGQNYGNNKPNQDFGGQNYGNSKPNQDFGGQNHGYNKLNYDYGMKPMNVDRPYDHGTLNFDKPGHDYGSNGRPSYNSRPVDWSTSRPVGFEVVTARPMTWNSSQKPSYSGNGVASRPTQHWGENSYNEQFGGGIDGYGSSRPMTGGRPDYGSAKPFVGSLSSSMDYGSQRPDFSYSDNGNGRPENNRPSSGYDNDRPLFMNNNDVYGGMQQTGGSGYGKGYASNWDYSNSMRGPSGGGWNDRPRDYLQRRPDGDVLQSGSNFGPSESTPIHYNGHSGIGASTDNGFLYRSPSTISSSTTPMPTTNS